MRRILQCGRVAPHLTGYSAVRSTAHCVIAFTYLRDAETATLMGLARIRRKVSASSVDRSIPWLLRFFGRQVPSNLAWNSLLGRPPAVPGLIRGRRHRRTGRG